MGWTTVYQGRTKLLCSWGPFPTQKLLDKRNKVRQALLGLASISSISGSSPSGHRTTYLHIFLHTPLQGHWGSPDLILTRRLLPKPIITALICLFCGTMNLRRKCNPCRITHPFYLTPSTWVCAFLVCPQGPGHSELKQRVTFTSWRWVHVLWLDRG